MYALARALEIIHHLIAAHLAHKAGFTCRDTATGAVTLVQRFGSAMRDGRDLGACNSVIGATTSLW